MQLTQLLKNNADQIYSQKNPYNIKLKLSLFSVFILKMHPWPNSFQLYHNI